jgi:multiple sugar transport system substrate-binding protein
MKKNISLGLILIFLATSLLAGCGATQPQQAANGSGSKIGSESGEPVTIRFWRRGNDPVLHDYWLNAIKQFEAANPGYKVDFSESSFDDYDIKLNAAYASGDVPDVITHSILTIGERTAKGQFAPLDEFANKWDGKSDFIPKLIDSGSYKGNLYGIPVIPGSNLLVFRKDFAIDAGLDPENPPVNLTQFAEWAEKMTKRDGNTVTRSGFVIPRDDYNLLCVFAAIYGDKKVVDATDPSFDTPEMRKALTYLSDLYKNKKVSADTTSSNEKKTSQFVNGKAAIQILAPSALAQMTKADPTTKDKIGFIYLKENASAYWSGLQFFFISSDSKKKEAAWKFIEYMSSPDQVWERYTQAQVPVVRKSLVEKANNDDKWLNPAVAFSLENGINAPKVTWSSVYLNKYTADLLQQVLLSQKTPDQVIKENWKALQQEIAQMK